MLSLNITNSGKDFNIFQNMYIFSSYSFFLFFIIFCFSSYCYSQSMQDIDNIRKQYQEALKNQELQKPKEIKDAEATAKSTSLPDKVIYTRKEVESLIANTQKLLDRLNSLEDSAKTMQYIGYDIFEVRDTIPFWQNLPTPNDYVLGPGDEIIISLYGSIEQTFAEMINRDGQVFLKDVGTLSLVGMNIDNAKRYIQNRYSKVYSTLLGQKPTTFLDITLGELKSINIHVVGYAVYPGIHIVHPFSSVFSSLAQAGGVDVNGSLRHIKIIRKDKVISNVDLYDYLFLGKALSDVRLLDQDIIFIPPRKSTIAIAGMVKSPGYYESIPNESIKALVDFSGGFSTLANNYIHIMNGSYNNNRSEIIKRDDMSSYTAFDGDSLHITKFHSSKKYVLLDGKVKSPGVIPFKNGITLSELLEIDGSLGDAVFKETIDTNNIAIFRRMDNSQKMQKLFVDLSIDKNFPLQIFDQISVPPNNNRKPLKSVVLSGEILAPGLYNVNNQKSLKDIIKNSGGFTKDALDNGIEVFRDSFKVAWENMDFVLEDGDSLHVLKKTGTVQVLGEVYNPGYFTFNKRNNAKDYIDLAGGFNSFAEPRDVTVVDPNGIARPRRRFGWQFVPEGGKIIVHKRSLIGSSKGPSGWETFSIISAQAGNIATTLLTLMILISQTSNTSSG